MTLRPDSRSLHPLQILAGDELRSLKPLPTDSLSSFLLRFQSVAQRASNSTSLLETGLSIEDEFKQLHNLMKIHSNSFGTWVKTEWFSRYNKESTQLRSLTLTELSPAQCNTLVRASIRRLIADMRGLDAMKQDESDVFVSNRTQSPPFDYKKNDKRHSDFKPYRQSSGYFHGPPPLPPLPPLAMPLWNANPMVPNVDPAQLHISDVTYKFAHEILKLDKREMDDRYSRRECATCVARIPLINAIIPPNKRRIQYVNGKTWRLCEGLDRKTANDREVFTDQQRKAYREAVATGFNTARRPTRRVSSCAHVFNTSPVCTFPTISSVQVASNIMLVTSQVVQPVGQDHHVLSHMTHVHGDAAFHALHYSAIHKHTCIEVEPVDIRVCLSQVARAYNTDPLNTSVSSAIPRKDKLRHLWMPYLKDYVLSKSVYLYKCYGYSSVSLYYDSYS